MTHVHYFGSQSRPFTSNLSVRYCTKCGTELIDRLHGHHFSATSGIEIFRVFSKCPNKLHSWDGHNGYWRREGFELYKLFLCDMWGNVREE